MNNDNNLYDIFKPKSVLQYIDLKAILNADSLQLLPPYFQCQLLKLLPPCELQVTHNGKLKYSFDCLKNEYISQAIMEWQDKLSDGVVFNNILADHLSLNHLTAAEMERPTDERNPLKRIYNDSNLFRSTVSLQRMPTVPDQSTTPHPPHSHPSNIKRRRSCANQASSLDDDDAGSKMSRFDSNLTKARVVLHRVMLKRCDVYDDSKYLASL